MFLLSVATILTEHFEEDYKSMGIDLFVILLNFGVSVRFATSILKRVQLTGIRFVVTGQEFPHPIEYL